MPRSFFLPQCTPLKWDTHVQRCNSGSGWPHQGERYDMHNSGRIWKLKHSGATLASLPFSRDSNASQPGTSSSGAIRILRSEWGQQWLLLQCIVVGCSWILSNPRFQIQMRREITRKKQNNIPLLPKIRFNVKHKREFLKPYSSNLQFH